jgi:gluconate 2-dehydrogenase gamma chain
LKYNRLSRRVFIGSSLALGVGTAFWFNSGNNKKIKVHANNVQVLLQCAYHVFPQSKLGPGAMDLNISSYLSQMLVDERIMQEDRHYFLQGATWLEESAHEEFNKSFLNLRKRDKEYLLQMISRKRWGENFIYTTLSYIFEALLSSPVYGSNKNEIGWKWLEHQAGYPQPSSKEEITYEV